MVKRKKKQQQVNKQTTKIREKNASVVVKIRVW